jgi:hypothetical protein
MGADAAGPYTDKGEAAHGSRDRRRQARWSPGGEGICRKFHDEPTVPLVSDDGVNDGLEINPHTQWRARGTGRIPVLLDSSVRRTRTVRGNERRCARSDSRKCCSDADRAPSPAATDDAPARGPPWSPDVAPTLVFRRGPPPALQGAWTNTVIRRPTRCTGMHRHMVRRHGQARVLRNGRGRSTVAGLVVFACDGDPVAPGATVDVNHSPGRCRGSTCGSDTSSRSSPSKRRVVDSPASDDRPASAMWVATSVYDDAHRRAWLGASAAWSAEEGASPTGRPFV